MFSLIPPVILFLPFFKVSATASFSADLKSDNDPEATDARLVAFSSSLAKFILFKED